MIRRYFLTVFAGLLAISASLAQTTPGRFRWQSGQVLTYRVEQVTSASEVIGGNKSETSTRMKNVKRWQVLGVDDAGVATLQMSLTALRLETTTPSGEVLLFDSAHPDQSNSNLREELGRYVGPPLVVLRIDVKGTVIEVKECKYSSASRFQAEPPFILTLPDEGPKAGQAWERTYPITLEPPQGTGEKYQAVQKYLCKSVADGSAVITIRTLLNTQPEALADRVPLLQVQPEGEVLFDTQAGFPRKAQMRIDRELTDHQGEGSSYRFQSTYMEEYVDSRNDHR